MVQLSTFHLPLVLDWIHRASLVDKALIDVYL